MLEDQGVEKGGTSINIQTRILVINLPVHLSVLALYQYQVKKTNVQVGRWGWGRNLKFPYVVQLDGAIFSFDGHLHPSPSLSSPTPHPTPSCNGSNLLTITDSDLCLPQNMHGY